MGVTIVTHNGVYGRHPLIKIAFPGQDPNSGMTTVSVVADNFPHESQVGV